MNGSKNDDLNKLCFLIQIKQHFFKRYCLKVDDSLNNPVKKLFENGQYFPPFSDSPLYIAVFWIWSQIFEASLQEPFHIKFPLAMGCWTS